MTWWLLAPAAAVVAVWARWRIGRRRADTAQVVEARRLTERIWRIAVARELLAKRAKCGEVQQYTFAGDWYDAAQAAGLIAADGSILWSTVEVTAAERLIEE